MVNLKSAWSPTASGFSFLRMYINRSGFSTYIFASLWRRQQITKYGLERSVERTATKLSSLTDLNIDAGCLWTSYLDVISVDDSPFLHTMGPVPNACSVRYVFGKQLSVTAPVEKYDDVVGMKHFILSQQTISIDCFQRYHENREAETWIYAYEFSKLLPNMLLL